MKLDYKSLFIELFITILGAGECINLLTLVKHFELSFASRLFLLAIIAVFIAFLVLLTISVKKNFSTIKNDFSSIFNKKSHIGLFIFIIGMILFQIIYHYFLCKPFIQGDLTGETAISFVRSNSLFEINPLTGYAYTDGVPSRIKILCVPFIYASISKVSGISAYTVIYRLAPAIVILLAYLLYYQYAEFFFKESISKKLMFMAAISLVIHFGYLGVISESRFLLLQAWSGEAIRNIIILPFIILSLLRKRWWDVILCILAEAVLCWTLYGLGFGIVITIVYLIVILILKLRKKEVQ